VLEVRQAWLRCEKSRRRHDVAGTARDSAEESLRVARDRHLPGLATQTEVLAAESQRTQAEGNLANAQFERASSALALRLAIGEL
jgi:outer membrane protein TolC